ncbi:redox-sensitive transcriptional activator SoxR [Streptomyces sp. NPDC007369]|uniref:redox-sensitive transcriptional activator SoxR n=1 Tax=Streptomyces sp. NPDC007369 TaxID=3154589 RepID=UPI0034086F9A
MANLSWTLKELTVGELAERSGVSPSALRFYENEGLIQSRRTQGNQRRYNRDVLRRVAVITVSKRAGIPLDVIKDVLGALPSDRVPTVEEWAGVAARWDTLLTVRIDELTMLRDGLVDCIGCGCLTVEGCQRFNPLDRLGREGPGPRRFTPRRRESASAGDSPPGSPAPGDGTDGRPSRD